MICNVSLFAYDTVVTRIFRNQGQILDGYVNMLGEAIEFFNANDVFINENEAHVMTFGMRDLATINNSVSVKYLERSLKTM